jgi:hypothetical protein
VPQAINFNAGFSNARTAPPLTEQGRYYATDQIRPSDAGRPGASRSYPHEPGDPGRY